MYGVTGLRTSRKMVTSTLSGRQNVFVTLSHMCDKNAKRYRAAGHWCINPFTHAAAALGSSSVHTISAPQLNFRRDLTILIEASTTSAEFLVTADERFYDILNNSAVN